MATPRPDVKFYLDAKQKAALKAIAKHRGLTDGKLVEQVMGAWLDSQVHDASVLVSELQRAGVIGYAQEKAGEGRK